MYITKLKKTNIAVPHNMSSPNCAKCKYDIAYHLLNVSSKSILGKQHKHTFLLDELPNFVYLISFNEFVCLFVLLLYVPSQQLWSLGDGQFT